jgi:hypothetical protein
MIFCDYGLSLVLFLTSLFTRLSSRAHAAMATVDAAKMMQVIAGYRKEMTGCGPYAGFSRGDNTLSDLPVNDGWFCDSFMVRQAARGPTVRDMFSMERVARMLEVDDCGCVVPRRNTLLNGRGMEACVNVVVDRVRGVGLVICFVQKIDDAWALLAVLSVHTVRYSDAYRHLCLAKHIAVAQRTLLAQVEASGLNQDEFDISVSIVPEHRVDWCFKGWGNGK